MACVLYRWLVGPRPNGTDCGYYVMQTIRMLVEKFIQRFESNQFVSIYEN